MGFARRWRRGPPGKPVGRKARAEGSVSGRLLAWFGAHPLKVIPQAALSVALELSPSAMAVPLTRLVVDGRLIESEEGFCLATPQARARQAVSLARRPALSCEPGPGDHAREIVLRARILAGHGLLGAGLTLLYRAYHACRDPLIATNFRVAIDLIEAWPQGYRDIDAGEARTIAAAAGCLGRGRP